MRIPTLISVWLAAFAANSQVYGAQLHGLDDFDDNVRDVAKWGESDSGLFNGVLTETNGRIEYSVSQSASFVDFATRTWRLNAGSATNDWLTTVDVNLPDLELFTEGQGVQLTLGILLAGNASHNAGISVVHVREGGLTRRRYQSTIQRGGFTIPGTTIQLDRGVTLAKLQLRFTAADKVLRLEHGQEGVPGGWQEVAAYDLDSAEIDWPLAEGSSFELNLAGTSFSYRVVPADGVWLDDFLAASRPVILEQPESQSVEACESATFDVLADAGPLATYQWRLDSTELAGETESTLVVPDNALNRYGAYRVVVTNPAGSATSEPAVLSEVVVLPVLTWSVDANGFHVHWPAGSCGTEGFELEKRMLLSGGGEWEDVPPPYPVNNGSFDIVFPITGESMFFRLINR